MLEGALIGALFFKKKIISDMLFKTEGELLC